MLEVLYLYPELADPITVYSPHRSSMKGKKINKLQLLRVTVVVPDRVWRGRESSCRLLYGKQEMHAILSNVYFDAYSQRERRVSGQATFMGMLTCHFARLQRSVVHPHGWHLRERCHSREKGLCSKNVRLNKKSGNWQCQDRRMLQRVAFFCNRGLVVPVQHMYCVQLGPQPHAKHLLFVYVCYWMK